MEAQLLNNKVVGLVRLGGKRATKVRNCRLAPREERGFVGLPLLVWLRIDAVHVRLEIR
jgi:hypothetical protein